MLDFKSNKRINFSFSITPESHIMFMRIMEMKEKKIGFEAKKMCNFLINCTNKSQSDNKDH